MMTDRSCPACDAEAARAIITMSAEEVVRGNQTYQPSALERLGLAGSESFRIGMCQRCGFVYALAAPNERFLEALYDEVIDPELAAQESQSPGWIAHQLHLAAGLLERLGDRRVTILDYGCGFGAALNALKGPGIQRIGYEISTNAVKYTTAQGLDVTSSLQEVRDAAPYDGVLLSDVLEHVPDPREVLATCRDLLAPRGWVCVSVPDFGSRRLERIVADRLGGRTITREVNPWEHLNYFSPDSLANMLRESGLAVEARPDPAFGFQVGSRGVRRFGNALKSAARLLAFAFHPRQMTTTIFAQRS